MSEINIFEVATRKAYRFPSIKGLLTLEDLWNLKLTGNGTTLDTVAREISRDLKAEAEESFVTVKSTRNESLSNHLEIVKHIISVKLAEKEQRANAVANKAQKDKILDILATKRDQELVEKTPAELEAMIAAL